MDRPQGDIMDMTQLLYYRKFNPNHSYRNTRVNMKHMSQYVLYNEYV